MPAPEDPRPFAAAEVQPGDPWRAVEFLEEVGSTNAVLVADPLPWRVLVAEKQRDGRGRLARRWVTTPGLGLAVSVVVPPGGMPLGWVPLTAGLALATAVTATSGVAAVVKWPNDVLLPADGERKVAGILCEWTPSGVVVGTGVNVGHVRAELPLESATSVRAAGGEVSREALLTAYLKELAGLVELAGRDPRALRGRYTQACATIGATVRVEAPSGIREGTATAVDSEGRLGLRTTTGEEWVSAGDVIHVRRCP